MPASYQKYQQVSAGMRKQQARPEAVSQAFQQAIQAACPKARYPVAFPFTGRLVLHLGDAAWDLVPRQMFKLENK